MTQKAACSVRESGDTNVSLPELERSSLKSRARNPRPEIPGLNSQIRNLEPEISSLKPRARPKQPGGHIDRLLDFFAARIEIFAKWSRP
jgi:hypothetical protein